MPTNKAYNVSKQAEAIRYGLLALDTFYEEDPPDNLDNVELMLDEAQECLNKAANYLIAAYEENKLDLPVVLQQLKGG